MEDSRAGKDVYARRDMATMGAGETLITATDNDKVADRVRATRMRDLMRSQVDVVQAWAGDAWIV